jgi:cobalt/nickel transport system permease protein
LIEEGFSIGDSVIHRLDPRARTVVACAYSIVVALSCRFSALLFALFLSIVISFLAGLQLKQVLSRLLVVNLFIFLFWIIVPFTFEGAPLFSIGALGASREGIIYTALITVKSNSIILILMSLIATMPIFRMGRAMRYLFVPSKIVHLFLFTYRYIHAIHREYIRLKEAMDIRGFRPRNNIHTYKSYAYLVGMLLVKSHDRAERVRAAMLCRGFTGRFYDLSEFSMGRTDLIFLIIMLLAIGGIGFFQWATIIY